MIRQSMITMAPASAPLAPELKQDAAATDEPKVLDLSFSH